MSRSLPRSAPSIKADETPCVPISQQAATAKVPRLSAESFNLNQIQDAGFFDKEPTRTDGHKDDGLKNSTAIKMMRAMLALNASFLHGITLLELFDDPVLLSIGAQTPLTETLGLLIVPEPKIKDVIWFYEEKNPGKTAREYKGKIARRLCGRSAFLAEQSFPCVAQLLPPFQRADTI